MRPLRRLLAIVGLLLAVELLPLGAPAPSSAGDTTAGPPYRVGLRAIRIVERRKLRLPDGRIVPRTLETYVRYPLNGPGHYPLVVFAHGFDITPHPYAPLLGAIARAGFVVAAPVFPLTNPRAPGGPNENDLVNQPGDMSAVITRMILDTRRPGNRFHGLINGQEVAVAGQSDGGITALLAAYNRRHRDRRVKAAIVMSGAELHVGSYDFAPGSPPLLATQGTADTTNLPENTYRFFAQAARPKFLLKLLGAQHLPPYTTEQPQLGIVERTAVAFLRRYLDHRAGQMRVLKRAGNVPGVTTLTAKG